MTKFTFCPNCGAPQPENTSDSPFICGECDYTFYVNPASAVAGIIEVDNKILLTKRGKAPGKDKLDLPGGFVDRYENLEAALSREVFEELGIHIDGWQYLCSATNRYLYKNETYHTCDAIFFCQMQSQPIIQLDTSEIGSAMWLDMADLPLDQIAFESIKIALQQYIENKKQGL